MIEKIIAWSRRAGVVGLAVLAVAGGSAWAQDKAWRPVEVLQKRALLIGNADYAHTTALKNTLADVRALQGALRELGFDSVTRLENLTMSGMLQAVEDFAAALGQGDLAFFYYSGHGLQADGRNFLLPVDFSRTQSAAMMRAKALEADVVRETMEGTGARLRVLVLDACRDNPFQGSKSGASGLAAMNARAEGDLIAYATAAGRTASDNPEGDLGLYMTHLLPELRRPTVELEEAFERTQAAVWEASGKRQFPAVYDNMAGKFYLRGTPTGPLPQAAQAVPVTPPLPPAVRTPPAPGGMTAAERWGAIKGTERVAELKAYIESYRGDPEAAVFVSLARVRLKATEKILQERAAQEEQERLARSARAAYGAVMEADDVEVLGTFVRVYGTVAGVADLVEQARGRLMELGEQIEWSNSLGMEFVWVPAGEFRMGSTSSQAEEDEKRVTRVRLSRGFYLGKYEVTQGEWEAVMGENPSGFKNCGANCPVENVSWEDAQDFIRKLNAREGGGKYRLPTEAEWEHAARAGTRGDYYDSNLGAIAWYDGNSGDRTHPVGRKAPNAFGLHDMLGNVWEWVGDWYGEYPGGTVTDPEGPRSGSERVGRGGSYFDYARHCRSTDRFRIAPGYRIAYLGFRLLRTE